MPRTRHQDPTPQQRSDGTWFFIARLDVIRNGKIERPKQTVDLPGEFRGKREARTAVREKMQELNKTDSVAASQVRVARLIEQWELLHLPKQSKSTQGKYKSHLKNHIKPGLGEMLMCEIGDALLLQKWLDSKNPENGGKLSWATRTDLRNILSSLFTQAKIWGLWNKENPVEHVHAGKKRAVREKRKLTNDQTCRLLAELPWELRIACSICLFCTLRISEVMGLQEKHIDFARGEIQVRQRYWRGDLDETKSDSSRREVSMGHLASDLKKLCMGNPERFVFQVETHPDWGRRIAICRDDRDLLQHFLRPAAVKLGFYYKGFGFHALRREAITAYNDSLGVTQAMRMSGHTSAEMSALYTLKDRERQDAAVRARQESILGKPEGNVQ